MNPRRRAALVTLALAAALLLWAAKPAHPAPPPKAKPAWRVDLRPYGYRGPFFGGKPALEEGHWLPGGVVFLDDSRLAALIFYDAGDQGLVPRGRKEGVSRYRLRTIVLSVESGQVLASRDWSSSPVWPSGAVATSRGNLLVREMNRLVLVSNQLETLRELPLPPDELNPSRFTRTHLSTDGQWLLFHRREGEREFVKVLDADTFEEIEGWDAPRHDEWLAGAGSGKLLAMSGWGPRHRELYVRGLQQPWQKVPVEAVPGCTTMPTLIDADHILARHPYCLAVVTTEGKVLLERRFPERGEDPGKGPFDIFNSTRVARKAKRFAVEEQTLLVRGEKTYLKDLRLLVYQLARIEPVFSLKPKLRKWDFAYDLSPNGNLLTVKTDSTISLYRLPEP